MRKTPNLERHTGCTLQAKCRAKEAENRQQAARVQRATAKIEGCGTRIVEAEAACRARAEHLERCSRETAAVNLRIEKAAAERGPGIHLGKPGSHGLNPFALSPPPVLAGSRGAHGLGFRA